MPPAAGGFNLTDPSEFPADTGELAAHMKFVQDSINETLMEGANEACVSCHTHVGVNITWTKNVVLEFEASGDNVTESNYANTWVNP